MVDAFGEFKDEFFEYLLADQISEFFKLRIVVDVLILSGLKLIV